MHIEEITIDGFKSYAKRVTVQDFDPHFNAITGLNGSGKSNILDSICFVLGIKNLNAVRASNLQELVYKQGQAGVTKATVSITFDNSDAQTSPTGYEDKKKITVTRQIVVGGRDKYLINGTNAQQSRVQDLFHSVQLNVNNPHFLIMQGRITKVLNMKPAEILGLLEEAAGTKMYDKKRDVALKTLEKKEKRLAEIDQLLNEEMLPTLEKLRKERADYMEWQQACADAESLGQVVIAYQYWQLLQAAQEGDSGAAKMREQISELQDRRTDLEADMAAKSEEITALKTQMDLQSRGDMDELKKQCDKLGLAVAKGQGQLDAKKEDAQAQEQECAKLEAALEDVSEEKVAAVVAAAQEKSDGAWAALQQAEAAVDAASCALAGAESGDGRDESNRSLPERLRDAEFGQKRAEAEAKQAGMRAQHLRSELLKAQKDAAGKKSEDSKLERELAQQSAAVERTQQAIAALKLDDGRVAALQETLAREGDAVRHWRQQCSQIAGTIGHLLNFDYRAPRPGFDHSKVKGVLARLIRINNMEHATALEVAAGGKLSHIVVDTEEVGRDLLKGGGLKKRYTIVPLNKTRTHTVPPHKRATAAQLTAGRAQLALELVGYEEQVRTAMEYAFGGAFVCQDTQSAQKVAFSRDVGCRGISLAGDDFSPAGTLTGGSRSRNLPVLERMTELADAEAKLAEHQAAYQAAEAQMAALSGAVEQRGKLQEQLELAQHAVELVRARVESSAGHQVQLHLDRLQVQLGEAEAAAEAAEVQKQALTAEAKSLRDQIKNFDKERGTIIKQAKTKLEKAKKEVAQAQKVAAACEQELDVAVAQQESAAEERATLAEQHTATKLELKKLQEEASALQTAVDASRAELQEAEAELAAHKERLEQCHADVAKVTAERGELQSAAADLEVQLKKLEHGLGRQQKDAHDAARRIQAAEKEHGWVVKEKQRLGQPGGPYDFGAMDMRAKATQYNAAVAAKNEKGRNVNRSVLAMFEQCEKDYTGLTDRRRTVLNDRGKIKSVIDELDTKKESALELTWKKVNQDFGDIFTTLLPGTEAKLQPPEGTHFLDGLEVCVAFGGVWKESLSELSGGQRSLLALSLILSLLRFRPAPLYILDEVDAALDLSHTQNIGRMIKNYFPYAQFVIVSLKEGMFNNANVIFRTRFVDGSSTVTRTANAQSSKAGKQARPPPAKKGRTHQLKDAQQENVVA